LNIVLIDLSVLFSEVIGKCVVVVVVLVDAPTVWMDWHLSQTN